MRPTNKKAAQVTLRGLLIRPKAWLQVFLLA